MSYQIELRHYYYFKILAEELHYRKAANRLFISQPGLTRQIKQMEAILGVQLFERNQRNVELTVAGAYLAREVNYIFNYIDRVGDDVRRIGAGKKIQLKIGFIGSAAHTIIPRFIAQLSEKNEASEISMEEMSNTSQVAGLQQGQIDIGFVRETHTPFGLSLKNLQEETFSLVVPENFSMPRNKSKILQLARDKNFIMFSSAYSEAYYNLIMSIFADEGFTPHVLHKSVNALTIFELVEQGLGVAIIPTSLQYGYKLKVKFVELLHIRQRTQLSVVWNPRNRNPGLTEALKIWGIAAG